MLNYDYFINLDFNSNVKTHADCRMLMKLQSLDDI